MRASKEDADVDTAVDDEHRLIAEVTWTGGDDLLLRETNRESDIARLVHFDLSRSAGRGSSVLGGIVRRRDTRKEPGWIAHVSAAPRTRDGRGLTFDV
jgi:dipeptidyl aminopeptidase